MYHEVLPVTAVAAGPALLQDGPPARAAIAGGAAHGALIVVLEPLAVFIIALLALYTIRHLVFTLNRLLARQHHPYLDIVEADWPHVAVLIPAHNEAAVIAHVLDALLEADYPRERLRIVPIDDRSEDATGRILDDYAARHCDLIHPRHRSEGLSGKAAALASVTGELEAEIVLVFDADYLPGPRLIKQLVSPFFDPEVGAVMGRVVPHNSACNLLTRLQDLERAGGYQVDQQARMNLGLVPQYGGTVGGVRLSALREVGGWDVYSLAEDTEMTFRLLLNGWKTVYQNRAECYEEVVENWPARFRQLRRWSRGHNRVLMRYIVPLLASRVVSMREKLDGVALLGIYVMAPILMLGWLIIYLLWLLGDNHPGFFIMLAVVSYGTFGNAASFYQLASAAHLDGTPAKGRLVPLAILGYLVSTYAVTSGLILELLAVFRRRHVHWQKTERFRAPGAGHGEVPIDPKEG
ncbi:glycosyltransferase family 2 protein [Acidihalobacter prosperus]|uniref:Glycosyl transferase family 2 n=1 Tax=Acidihalobacter prosperus TaxID=160660 RepID=A0A1A6C0N0_9GAMM|nr:glycosyltransferase [Acidihalobacter prosperus]OBS08108.1 glycosyl transferase family 2 [Acidihalobacter prosperus]